MTRRPPDSQDHSQDLWVRCSEEEEGRVFELVGGILSDMLSKVSLSDLHLPAGRHITPESLSSGQMVKCIFLA